MSIGGTERSTMPKNSISVLLMNEDKSLSLEIGFFGYSYDDVEKYMTKTFIESDKAFAKKYTQMKYVGAN